MKKYNSVSYTHLDVYKRQAYGLRAKAKNFDIDTMKEGIDFAHEHGAKVYITANIFAHNSDFDGMDEYFKKIYEIGADAVLVSDPGVYMTLKEAAPDMELHISTQANNTNYKTANFWYNMGAKRIVGARELSLKEIKEMRSKIPDDMEIETFVHGAMCISCLLYTSLSWFNHSTTFLLFPIFFFFFLFLLRGIL